MNCSAPRPRASSRHAANACRLAWISAKTASSTIFLRADPIPQACTRFEEYQTTAGGRRAIAPNAQFKAAPQNQAAIRCGDSRRTLSTLARDLESPEQQRQQRVDPRRVVRVAPFIGMGGMME